MNSHCERIDIGIVRVGNDSRMGLRLPMQSMVVIAVVGEHDPVEFNGPRQHIRIINAEVGAAVIEGCQHVMPQCNQSNDQRESHIFIGIKCSHDQASLLVRMAMSISSACER